MVKGLIVELVLVLFTMFIVIHDSQTHTPLYILVHTIKILAISHSAK